MGPAAFPVEQRIIIKIDFFLLGFNKNLYYLCTSDPNFAFINKGSFLWDCRFNHAQVLLSWHLSNFCQIRIFKRTTA